MLGRMALSGLRVVEMAGLAPVPLCGMILSDFGANVIRVDKVQGPDMDCLGRGKRSIAVDLKQEEGREVVKRLCQDADVFIEPFRPRVMEKLGLGSSELMARNPRLIYASLTGYGQSGPLAARAGHDINYLAISGLLSRLGRKGEKPYAPINLLADFAGGGLNCAFGIVMSLLERTRTGKGQVIDSSMVEGAAYVGSWIWRSQDLPGIWGGERGTNWLDGGVHFYDTYRTKDDKYMAVGAIEPQFYAALLEGLGLTDEDAPQFDNFEKTRETFSEIFASKTQSEWCEIFDDVDACVTPVLNLEEAPKYHHNAERKAFFTNRKGGEEPQPAPRLSRTPSHMTAGQQPIVGQHTKEILIELGYKPNDVNKLENQKVVIQARESKL